MISLFFNSTRIKFKVNENLLGLIIDEEVKFAVHSEYVCSKVSKAVGLLYKLRDYIPQDVMLSLYYSLAFPYILYGNLVWGGTYEVHLQSLVLKQKNLLD